MKKFLAMVMAFTMLFSMSTIAFADPTAATGTDTTSGSGGTAYVDTEVYEVLLPTSNSWNFVLDPQGLI